MPDYLPYSPAVETFAPDEHVTFDELSRVMQDITRRMAARYRHAYRPVHAKSHGILMGSLDVLPNLPRELAQGIFQPGASYPVLFRFSTNPGDILPDKVSSPRGLAIKVIGVSGERVPSNPEGTSQDFVCINGDAFAAPDPKGFLKSIKLFDKGLDVGEETKTVISTVARATNAVLKAVHLPSATLEGIGASATHILGESFSTIAPVRYGDYVAKIGFAPGSDNLKELTGKGIDLGEDYNALELMIHQFFRKEGGVWDVKVQLALAEDPTLEEKDKSFPIEKADVEWPEETKDDKPGSPWQVVARITMPAQDSYSDARQRYVDEQLSFNPWHALAAHRPLGGIMRSRLKAYEEAIKYRVARNDRPRAEPETAEEVPV